jgi:xanthine dehydrogenase accessory factor
VKAAVLESLLAADAARRRVVLVTDLDSGAQVLLHPDEAPPAGSGAGDLLWRAAVDASGRDASTTLEHGGRTLLLHVFNPPPRLVVVGAVHIAQALAPMAALAGYAVTVIDPRGAFASVERFPGVVLVTSWPDEALAREPPDARTAVVTLTHDPKLDDPALAAALRTPAFYVGALGSRKTHAARLSRLAAAGLDETSLARIHGPAGLAIGARTPAEIATSVLAQVIAAARGAAT